MNNNIREILWSILSTLTVEERPDWDQVSRSWVQALLDCDSEPIEKMVFKLGDTVRRQQRTPLIAEIDKTLSFLAATESDNMADTAVAA